MRYRAEIDGLRALAVVPVILFHAGFGAFSGGFVGVDVFFVISGFLITSIIIAELDQGTFSIVRFYERRARRILPALFTVMLACIPFALVLMIPSQLRLFAKSLVATSLFSSNFLFWKETNYFGTAAEEKPLLHTWSLAVEEQYYVLFPILLIILWRFGRKPIFYAIIAIALSSLAFSEWGWRNVPTANFFLAPMRIWELLFGSICAFLVFKNRIHSNEPLALVGVVLIIFSIFAFGKDTPFPSVYALVPVIGTCLIILFATGETKVGKLLSNQLIVSVGLISYSAYLWHQPIFAFARIGFKEHLNEVVFLAMTALSFLLAYLSWRFVEIPFRVIKNRPVISTTTIFTGSLIGIAVFVSIGIVGNKTKGLRDLYIANRLTPQEAKIIQIVDRDTQYNLYDHMVDDGDCKFWGRTVTKKNLARFADCTKKHQKAIIVLGDSHAMNIHNIVAKADVHPFVFGISQGGCRPHKIRKNCHYEAFADFLAAQSDNIKTIIYHQSGSYFIADKFGKLDSNLAFGQDGRFEFNDQNIKRVSSYLATISKKANVIWLGPFVEARIDFNDYNYLFRNLHLNQYSIEAFDKLDVRLRKLIEPNISNNQFRYFSLVDALDIQKEFLKSGDCITYRDTDHFSRCGEDIIARLLRPEILKLTK